MNLLSHLASRAKQHPERLALVDANTSLSYLELQQRVSAGARQLQRDGLGPGDTVLILQPVGIPLYLSLLSAFHAGLTVMFIDPSASKKVIRHCLQLHQPQAYIATAKAHLLRINIPEIRRIPHLYHSSAWVPASRKWQPCPEAPSAPVSLPEDAPALITFTSGSTGMPKAACRSHAFLLAQHKALAESLDLREAEVDLITLPVFALANLASGLTSVIADTDLRFPAKADSVAISKQCRQHQVSRCAASPAFFAKLQSDHALPAFNAIYTGGAPVFPCLLDALQSTHPGMQVVTVFGSTEAEPISHIAWQDTSESDRLDMVTGQGLLVGQAVTATRLRIIPDQTGTPLGPMEQTDFDALELAPGEIGEIVVTGCHVLKGYLHGIGNEESKISVHQAQENTVWHRTGDAAWRDLTGRIWLMGRCSAAIHRPRQAPVYPFGIECAAMNHPAVTRCSLLMHQDQITLVVEGSLSDAESQQLQSELSQLEVEQILHLPHLPVDKRHNAKIDYPELLRLLG